MQVESRDECSPRTRSTQASSWPSIVQKMPDTHNRSLVAATSGCAGIVLVSVCSCPLP